MLESVLLLDFGVAAEMRELMIGLGGLQVCEF